MALRDVVTRFIEKMASPPFTSHQPWYAGNREDMGSHGKMGGSIASFPHRASKANYVVRMMEVSMICC